MINTVKRDLGKRFAAVGVVRYFYILQPDWVEPPPNTDGNSQQALQNWAGHFALDKHQLERQWAHMHNCRRTYLAHNPATTTQAPHKFWPPLLAAQWAQAPEMCRRNAAVIVLAWQNASVERDLAVLTRVRERAASQLGMTRLSARCRAVIEGPEPSKKRGEPVTGIVKRSAKLWWAKRSQQAHPRTGTPRGLQGPLPKRGRRSGERLV